MEIFIKDLFEDFDISVRAYNACDKVKIKTIDDARRHLDTYGSFLNIQNCGSKTSKEIIEAIERCSKMKIVQPSTNTALIEVGSINHKLGDKAINELLLEELDKLSVRARNGMLRFFGNKVPTKEQIKLTFIDRTFDAQKIENIGKKSVPEINSFIKAAIDIFDKSAYLPITDKTKAFSTFFDLVGFKVESEFWLKKHEEKKIPIIVFAEQYISEIFEISGIDAFIFKNEFHLLERYYSLDEIGLLHGLTRERIRQRRSKIIPNVLSKASKLIPLIEFSDYSKAIPNEKITCLRIDISDEILLSEVGETSDVFASLILSALSAQKTYTLNCLDKLDKPSVVQHYEIYNSLRTFNKSYLIDCLTINKSSLLKICSVILAHLSKRQTKNLQLDIRRIYKGDFSEDIVNVVRNIAENQFGIQMHGHLISIQRNSVKPIYEFIYEALSSIGKPAHMSEIRESILKVNSDFDSPEESMRASINNRKNIFIYFGRSSKYGLKEWEGKFENIKGGTIRDIVEEFLADYEEPCHISAITKYVNKYRKTDVRSVLHNLKLTSGKRFSFFNGGYVGLAIKNYQKLNRGSKYNYTEVKLDSLMAEIFSK